ncbi:trypsin-like serine protease [Amycolatopsis cihanbeyliensis]|uniref:trypsin-like serine protease n=1 Tax=Amycolatopsis cihanbeyliensis TaxID=1128664 RepID=UPI001FE5D242|nr:trypsin-like serine protease [Amycolatopsis cihanbeyliensis]
MGGGPAPEGEYGFVAEIYIQQRECSAALVDVEWLVTASSCFAEDPGEGFPIPPGVPGEPVTAVVGGAYSGRGEGRVRSVVELVPREDRDLVLARLDEPVLDVTPVPISTMPAGQDEVLNVVGYGRTAEVWQPDELNISTFSVAGVNPSTIDLQPAAEDAALCKGDAGGPAVREVEGRLELVGIHSRSWQHGCLGVEETRTGAVDTRVDDLTGWLDRSPLQQRVDTDPALEAEIGTPVGSEVVEWPYRYREFERGRLYWSADTEVTAFIRGPILDRYLALGGHGRFGAPTIDEVATPDGVARYNHFSKNASIYWTPDTGAHGVWGEIRKKWAALDWERGPMGYPTTDEVATPDGVARYNHFTKNASIYWTPDTGAHGVWGEIRKKWAALDWERGPMGYPTTDEVATPDGVARYNHFTKNASIYWTPDTGAHGVWGEIRKKWAALDWERGPMGYPTTDETKTPDGVGRYNHFTKGGSIYWSPGNGAHEIYGLIKKRWASLGWEKSYLGYPTSGEYSVPGGRRNNFEHGYIRWTRSTNTVIDRPY